MPRTRPPYPPEFRQEAARLLRSGARPPKQARKRVEPFHLKRAGARQSDRPDALTLTHADSLAWTIATAENPMQTAAPRRHRPPGGARRGSATIAPIAARSAVRRQPRRLT